MRKIAIVRRNGLGDLLCTFPTIAYLKAYDPELQITLFVDESNAPLLKYLPPVDEVVVFKRGRNKYFEILRTAWKFRKKRFDLAISAKTSPMKLINVFLFALGAKKRVAYVEKNWTGLLINEPVYYDPHHAAATHQALKTLQLIAPHLKEIPKQYYPVIQVPCKKQGPLSILLTASTTRIAHRLDAVRYAQLMNRLHAEGIPLEVHVISMPADHARARAIASELTPTHFLHFSKTFAEFMQIIGQADLVFCGDGGVAHIAAAMGKQVLILFGESRYKEWTPLGPYIKVLHDPIHVNHLSDERIYQVLQECVQGVPIPISC